MPKVNYLRALLDSLEEDQLRSIIETYAKEDRSFEAFVIDQSGQAVDTGKHYEDYRDELMKILSKCTSRKRGFVKVTRLKNAGMESFVKMLNSHFSNENYAVSLWMSLALMEMLQQAILLNTRYQWANKPYKSFEKIFLEARDQFDSSFRMTSLDRKERKKVFECFVRCWWNERQRDYPYQYFEIDDLFQYAERDEDFISLQESVKELLPTAEKAEKKQARSISSFKHIVGAVFSSETKVDSDSLSSQLQLIYDRAAEELQKW